MPPARALKRIGIATLFLAASAAFAGDVMYEVGDQVLVVNVDGNWDELDVSEVSPEAVGFEISGMMRFMFEPYPNRAKSKIPAGELRALTQDLRREIISHGGEVADDLEEVEGGQVRGYYVKGTTVESRASEYKFVYLGYVVVGDSLPVEFHIMWAKGGESIASRALSAIRNLRLART